MSDEAAAAAKAAAYAKKNKYRKDKRELQFCCVLQKTLASKNHLRFFVTIHYTYHYWSQLNLLLF
jgi:hypothetical protein